jgi:dTDP-4-dehydrorhamnose reductase
VNQSSTLQTAAAGPRRVRILLLGPTGQVGWELARTLQTLGEVVAAGRGTGAAGPACDLGRPEELRRVVAEVRPRLIVNAAAYTAVDQAESEPDLAMAVNGVAPGVLAEEARRIGAALVHYSTDYVFDGTGSAPWRETDPVGPPNTYGRTKLAGEAAIQTAGAAHLILRTSWVYGLHGVNFVKTMLRAGREREVLRVVDDQVGAPTSARVIADATGQILAQGLRDLPGFFQQSGGIVHLACGGESSWHAFALRIFELARARGLPLAIKTVQPIPGAEYPTPARRPSNSRLDCRRLFERFGLTPPDWQVALEQSFPN